MSLAVEDCDVVVVGARCAGTATAVPFARAGREVVVLDRGKFPSDQLSTHVLVPSGVSELGRMGALRRILALNPSRSTHLLVRDGDLLLRERFKAFDGIDYGLCIPRPEQDLCLVEAAREAGADVRERCAVEEVLWRDGRAVGVRYTDAEGQERELRAKLVVGADGRRSRVAAEVGSWQPYRGSRNGRGFAFRYMDDPKVGTDDHHQYGIYRRHRTITLTLPSSPLGRVLVVWMCPAEDIAGFRADAEAAWAAKLAADPDVAARVEGATNQGKVRSTADLSSYYRASSGPGWALPGDAGHFKDPVTGNGQRDAMRHGRLLAEGALPVLDDPAALDRALCAWERNRDLDTLSTYHWGNRETRPQPTSPLVREVLRTFSGGDAPDLSDTFNRVRPVEDVVAPDHLLRGLTRVLRKPGADRRGILREVAGEVPMEVDIRLDRWVRPFRSTKRTSTEHPGWTVGPQPRAAQPAEAVATADAAR